jgi:prevent-host-death family protein
MMFTVHQAKTQLSKLLAMAEAGEEVVIARRDKPAVKMVSAAPSAVKPARRFGAMKGKIALTDAFFEPLSEDELRAWEGD